MPPKKKRANAEPVRKSTRAHIKKEKFKDATSPRKEKSSKLTRGNYSIHSCEESASVVSLQQKIKDYCWLCHDEWPKNAATDQRCKKCHRAYHYHCLGTSNRFTAAKEVCPECRQKTVDGTVLHQPIPAKELETLLDIVQEKLVITFPDFEAWPPFYDAKRDEIKIMDLTVIYDNIHCMSTYLTTSEFLADVKLIYHNCVIVYGARHTCSTKAKNMVKFCREELVSVEACSECYIRSSSSQMGNDMTEPCNPPHPLAWAKMKGYPYWPSIVHKVIDGFAILKFFGTHDKGKVLLSQCLAMSEKCPNKETRNNRKNYDVSIHEMKMYIHNYEEKLGPFKYAPSMTPYNPGDELRLLRIASRNNAEHSTSPPAKRRRYGRPAKSTTVSSALISQARSLAVNEDSTSTLTETAAPDSPELIDVHLDFCVEEPVMGDPSVEPLVSDKSKSASGTISNIAEPSPIHNLNSSPDSDEPEIICLDDVDIPSISTDLRNRRNYALNNNGSPVCNLSNKEKYAKVFSALTEFLDDAQKNFLSDHSQSEREAILQKKLEEMAAETQKDLDNAAVNANKIIEKLKHQYSAEKKKASESRHALEKLEKDIQSMREEYEAKIIDIQADTQKKLEEQLEVKVQEMKLKFEKEKNEAIEDLKKNTACENGYDDKISLAIATARKKWEVEKKAIVSATKQTQWCATCQRKALFSCCWNTSYCNRACRAEHWPLHKTSCRNRKGVDNSQRSPSAKALKMPQIHPHNHSNAESTHEMPKILKGNKAMSQKSMKMPSLQKKTLGQPKSSLISVPTSQNLDSSTVISTSCSSSSAMQPLLPSPSSSTNLDITSTKPIATSQDSNPSSTTEVVTNNVEPSSTTVS